MNPTFELRFVTYAFVPGDSPGKFEFKRLWDEPVPISGPTGFTLRKYCETAFVGVVASMGKAEDVNDDYLKKPDLLIALKEDRTILDLDQTPELAGLSEGEIMHLLLNDKQFPRQVALQMLLSNVTGGGNGPTKPRGSQGSDASDSSLNRMDYFGLVQKVETTIRQIIRRCYPTSWHEDHITYCITDELGSFARMEITGLHRPMFVSWDARKFRGPTETALGDLGVLVHLTSWDGEQVEGIGIIEAKKRDFIGSAFSAVQEQQLVNINASAPRSRLLLYDPSDITEFGDNLPAGHSFLDSSRGADRSQRLPWSQAVTVPINLALAVRNFRPSLYKYSLPLSYQICSRYFRGFDLEFGTDVLRRVKGFIEGSGDPRYLLVVGVSASPGVPEPRRLFNEELYGQMDEDSHH